MQNSDVELNQNPQDMYAFHCTDAENGSVTEIYVHVDILWNEFESKLNHRFGRHVCLLYRRDETLRYVQNEDDFEDLCSYLDDFQVKLFEKKCCFQVFV